ncbi:hypothetical protein DKX38_008805 [Salix brachista]|uniref:UDP-glycosyltransferases domain-containing protein n=1 Tax=Salix brachista TaxID=2182728 RepID=A0A5N5M907_9ROSI|nr:hypothetical protein DKX38_008805 [Salix brachista]
MKKAEVVLIPIPAMGHIVALVEVAKLLVQRDGRLTTTVIIMHPALDPSTTKYTESLTASALPDRMRVVNLPSLESKTEDAKGRNWLTSMIEGHKPHVKEYVSNMRTRSQLSPDSPQLAGFIFDTFVTGMKEVADGFGVPWYVFSASGAAFICSMFYLQALHDDQGVNLTEFKNSDALLEIPGLANPLPAKLAPSMVFKENMLTIFLEHARVLKEARGILVNTYLEFESYALHSLSHGKNPPVYPVGPMVKHGGDGRDLRSDESDNNRDIMEWLDDQPPLSVMFLCFGSWGSFSGAQVKEIARALEHCGHRFLWSLRKPSSQKVFKSTKERTFYMYPPSWQPAVAVVVMVVDVTVGSVMVDPGTLPGVDQTVAAGGIRFGVICGSYVCGGPSDYRVVAFLTDGYLIVFTTGRQK